MRLHIQQQNVDFSHSKQYATRAAPFLRPQVRALRVRAAQDRPYTSGVSPPSSSTVSYEDIPSDVADAVRSGRVPPEILDKYRELAGNPIMSFTMTLGTGFRERLLADPGFFVKVAIEVGIGICTKCTAEYTKRGIYFFPQLDFVFANVLMALVADFMLVWLPAPTISLTKSGDAAANPVANIFGGCPDNAFQRVQPGSAPFTVAQRFGAVIRNGLKLFGVGLFASLLGVGITNVLIGMRQFMDPSFVPLNAPQNVLIMSAAYGVYMATSSNLRYQILAGLVEERGIETWFKGNHQVCAVLSFIVRTANTFLGSLLWVDFIRIIGLQKIGG